MNFTLDCEFNGYQGELLSLSLFNPAGSLYVYLDRGDETIPITPWVLENVEPHRSGGMEGAMEMVRHSGHRFLCACSTRAELPGHIEQYFHQFGQNVSPTVFADWPDDVKYLSEAVITGPGTMINIPGIDFKVYRVDAYPTDLPNAIQHHAWWDARVLWHKLRRMGVL